MQEEIEIPGPCVNFKIAVLARMMDERYKAAYKGLSLTNEQIRMLLKLKVAGPVTQHRLSQILELERSSFSRSLTAMIKKGFILKKSNPHDSRGFMLQLSTKGEAKVATIFPVWKKIHEDTMSLFGLASVQELDRMLRILKLNK